MSEPFQQQQARIAEYNSAATPPGYTVRTIGQPVSEQPAAPATLALSNLVTSPGTTFAGAAAICSVLAQATSHGFPVTAQGWFLWLATVAAGLAATFTR